MKKEYEPLEMEITVFATTDIMVLGISGIEDGGVVEDDEILN